MRDIKPANDTGRRNYLPPVTHVFVGGRLVRVDALTIFQARRVIERLCDELDEARDTLERIIRQ